MVALPPRLSTRALVLRITSVQVTSIYTTYDHLGEKLLQLRTSKMP